jgi:hypothetical protein
MCEACPDYHYRSTDGRQCLLRECPGDREIVNLDGTCLTCNDYFRAFDKNTPNRRCDQPTCSGSQYLNQKGICVDCPNGQIRDPNNNTQCLMPNCSARNYLSSAGTCVPCADFFISHPTDRTKCILKTCGDDQIVLPDTSC